MVSEIFLNILYCHWKKKKEKLISITYKLIPKYFLYSCYKNYVEAKTIVPRIFPKTLQFFEKKKDSVTDLRRKMEYEYSFFHFQFSIQNDNSTERTVATCEIT